MIWFAMLKESGCVALAGVSRMPPDGHVPLPAGVDIAEAGKLMRVDGEWTARPEIAAPVVTAGAVSLSPCPDGVVAYVSDTETGVRFGEVAAADDALLIELPDPGEYTVEFTAPEPWLAPAAIRVTV
jgi:hypothetical protein